MASKLARLLLCTALLVLFFATASLAQVNLESGKIGIRLSSAGSVRLLVPSNDGTRQIDRVNIIAAQSESAVCDYNEDQDVDTPAVIVDSPGKSDIEGIAWYSNVYSGLPPDVSFRLNLYMWNDQPYAIARITVTNDASETMTLYLGTVSVPRINGNYGGETDDYDAATQTAYCFREGETGYAGVSLLSHTTWSYKPLDWNIYSPDAPDEDAASDATRYHQTADTGIDAAVVASGDGSIFSLNAGAFTLAPQASVTLTYAVVYGDSKDDMLAAAAAVKTVYSEKFAPLKTQNFETGAVGVRISNAGSLRFVVPSNSGTRQIDRVNIIAAASETAVSDYNEDHDAGDGTEMLAFPEKADIEASCNFVSTYSNLPPLVHYNLHAYLWKDQPWVIAEYTVTNDAPEAVTLYLGTVSVPRINGSYGGETDNYDAATQMAYCFRDGEAGYAGVRLLSHAPYSYKPLDWNIYSPDAPDEDAASDSTRYHQTADGGFDGSVVAGGDGSIFSLNAGAVTLAPQASAKVVYAVAYGNSFDDLVTAANAAQVKYLEKFTTAVDLPSVQQPAAFALSQNWPNPFNPSTAVEFELQERTEVRLAVYNLKGELVNTIAAGVYAAGRHQAVWDGKDNSGRDVAAGIYLYRLLAGQQSWTRKMTLVR